mmetsp:Transcript_89436/g.278316  ORF Transcript_89436/g.278316 Transcript_89436/m.278316 type:complete len:203 (-) Transcript_89436:196-804(-)
MISSEEVHDEIARRVRGVPDPVDGGFCAIRDTLARRGGHVAEISHGGIPALLGNVLPQHGPSNRQATNHQRATGGRCDLGASAPLLFLLLVLGRYGLVLALDLLCGQGRGWPRGNGHEHGLAHFGRRGDIHGDHLGLVLGVRHGDRGARGARRHGDAEGGPSCGDGLPRRLPLVGSADVARLAGGRVLLLHLLEINLVVLSA